MAAASGSLLILGIIVAVAVSLAMGALVGWHLRGYRIGSLEEMPRLRRRSEAVQAPRAEVAVPAIDPEQLRLLLNQLQLLTERATSGMGEHTSRVEKISQSLASLGPAEEPLEHAVLNAAQQLLQANEQLRSELDSAKGQLQEHAKRIESHMAEARTDALAGVANRRAFDEELARHYEDLQKHDRGFSLILLDVDHFKKFNDCHGHLAGDEVLRVTARILSETVRDCDFVARYGGEEFAVIVPQASFFEAQELAEKLRAAVAAEKIEFQGRTLQVTASFGVAEARKGWGVPTLIKGADQALYAAKENGRNQAYLFNGTGCERIDPDWFESNRDMIEQVERQIDEEIRTGQPIDRRNQPRRPFRTNQFIAPCASDELPTREMFRQVPCHDISSGGFSFLLPEPPEFRNIVVALGAPPKVTYLAALVVHTRVHNSGPVPMYLVGCRFTGRVELGAECTEGLVVASSR